MRGEARRPHEVMSVCVYRTRVRDDLCSMTFMATRPHSTSTLFDQSAVRIRIVIS
jgi:hypothetical protein